MKLCFNCMKEIDENAQYCLWCNSEQKLENIPKHHLRPGTILSGRYVVGNALGQGGFGITYIGYDKVLQVRVAIKEYFPSGLATRISDGTVEEVTQSEEKVQYTGGKNYFLTEARVLAKFNNIPGIVSVKDYFEDNNTVYIVMEYLEGVTLKKYLTKASIMDPETVIAMMKPIIKALETVHREQLIHRDISPDNIMMTSCGMKLLDFGAARSFVNDEGRSMSVIMKQGYAPIEQYSRKGEQGPWTDVYSICATMYRCITGKVPYDAMERLYEDRLETFQELGFYVKPKIEQTIMKGLALRKADRIQNMHELLDALSSDECDADEPKTNKSENDTRVRAKKEPIMPIKQHKKKDVPTDDEATRMMRTSAFVDEKEGDGYTIPIFSEKVTEDMLEDFEVKEGQNTTSNIESIDNGTRINEKPKTRNKIVIYVGAGCLAATILLFSLKVFVGWSLVRGAQAQMPIDTQEVVDTQEVKITTTAMELDKWGVHANENVTYQVDSNAMGIVIPATLGLELETALVKSPQLELHEGKKYTVNLSYVGELLNQDGEGNYSLSETNETAVVTAEIGFLNNVEDQWYPIKNKEIEVDFNVEDRNDTYVQNKIDIISDKDYPEAYFYVWFKMDESVYTNVDYDYACFYLKDVTITEQ